MRKMFGESGEQQKSLDNFEDTGEMDKSLAILSWIYQMRSKLGRKNKSPGIPISILNRSVKV